MCDMMMLDNDPDTTPGTVSTGFLVDVPPADHGGQPLPQSQL